MEKGAKENKAKKAADENKGGVIYRYQGYGFIPGIPSRDIPEAEAKRRNILNTLEKSPLWVKEGE